MYHLSILHWSIHHIYHLIYILFHISYKANTMCTVLCNCICPYNNILWVFLYVNMYSSKYLYNKLIDHSSIIKHWAISKVLLFVIDNIRVIYATFCTHIYLLMPYNRNYYVKRSCLEHFCCVLTFFPSKIYTQLTLPLEVN